MHHVPVTATELLAHPAPTFPCGHPRAPGNFSRGTYTPATGVTRTYMRCRECRRQRRSVTLGSSTMRQDQYFNLAKLRDGVALHPMAVLALVRLKLAFFDPILKRYRPEPLTLAALKDREARG